jgi:hypothetical protein
VYLPVQTLQPAPATMTLTPTPGPPEHADDYVDHNKGHGNDPDRWDEDNPGRGRLKPGHGSKKRSD